MRWTISHPCGRTADRGKFLPTNDDGHGPGGGDDGERGATAEYFAQKPAPQTTGAEGGATASS